MSGIIDNVRFRKLLLAFPAKAIEFLYNEYYHSLILIALRQTHDRRASEDIVQETFVHVWEHYKELGQHHERSIQHYLVRVVKNKAITHFKRTVDQQLQKARYVNGQRFNTGPSVETEMIQLELSREVRKVIVTFPKRERECLLMKMDEEMTVEQMAERLKVSRKAVERSLTSGNKRLRTYWLSRK